ncbi:MAG: hypothetical protein HND53_06190 [Proteobacteria bacterium]|nr:hypothetical protein [Pseudomonadota bacterium]NOG60072.1 hypothetical protein [Pseudomonadota bacterium]
MPNTFNILKELQKVFSRKQEKDLVALFMHGGIDLDNKQALKKIVENIDWENSRNQIGQLLAERLPVEQLVPEQYSAWRDIVHEALVYFASHLSVTRLIPKLYAQVSLAEETALEKRVMIFIEQMPTLQKLGQAIARNRNLAPELRALLTQLENDIRDISAQTIKQQIEEELGKKLATHQIELDEEIHSEASVCALMRFHWYNAKTGRNEQGVFKVLKPHIKENFEEEITLLQGFATYLDEKKDHVLNDVNLHDTFADISVTLKQELDTLQEQANLHEAEQRYDSISGVRTPHLIRELSNSNITAMSFEEGIKVTDKTSEVNGKQLSKQMIETLIAIPLFEHEEKSLFHADPHAGNLYVNDEGELIIFDWALTGRLNREERSKIILLFLAVSLRDESLLLESIKSLAQEDLNADKIDKLMQNIKEFLRALSIYSLPGINEVLTLTDNVLLTGVRFSSSMMLFRKVLLTLDGVLNDIGETLAIENVVSQYVMQQLTHDMSNVNFWTGAQTYYNLPLSRSDALSLMWSAQWYGLRAGLQHTEKLLNH